MEGGFYNFIKMIFISSKIISNVWISKFHGSCLLLITSECMSSLVQKSIPALLLFRSFLSM